MGKKQFSNLQRLLAAMKRQKLKGLLMSEKKKQPEQQSLASFEANLFGDLMALQHRIRTRLREESLDIEKQKLVLDRLNSLVQTEIEDMEQTKELNMSKRLTSIAEQMDQFIDELSESE